jgi:fatty acid desaturase
MSADEHVVRGNLSKSTRRARAAWPNALAVLYALTGYAAGLYLAGSAGWLLAPIGTLWLAHAMIVAAYLLHEATHGAVFASRAGNARLGVLMMWLTGSCYARFETLQRKHMRHHIDRADVLTFDLKSALNNGATWLRHLILALEWACVPAADLMLHAYVMLLPFLRPERRRDRSRVLGVLLVRAAAFAALAIWSVRAAVLYIVAYLIMITVLRFADAFQHTYEAFTIDDREPIPKDPRRTPAYEQANTYSNVMSLRVPLLNLLLLNFPYHNAHHAQPDMPWYRLPGLHRQLYGAAYGQVLPMAKLLRPFHTHRVRRVVADDYGEVGVASAETSTFIGAVGVSFLTAV